MMFQKSLYLTYIYWRRLFTKDDWLTIGVLLAVFSFCLVGIYQTYEQNYYFLFIFLISSVAHHFGRNDFPLLQQFSDWRKIIFLEYLFNILPIVLIFSIKQDFLYAVLCVFVVSILVFLPQKSIKIVYPFAIFDPFWVVSFRRYKLIFLFPLLIFLLVMGKIYDNENLALFVFFLTAILGVIPYFEREFLAHILASKFKGEKYLGKQILCGMRNFTILFLPIFVLSLVLFSWKITFLGMFSYLIVMLAILTKYTFFENLLVQSIVFTMIMSGYAFGLPLICLPFLYYQAIKKIKKSQNVTD